MCGILKIRTGRFERILTSKCLNRYDKHAVHGLQYCHLTVGRIYFVNCGSMQGRRIWEYFLRMQGAALSTGDICAWTIPNATTGKVLGTSSVSSFFLDSFGHSVFKSYWDSAGDFLWREEVARDHHKFHPAFSVYVLALQMLFLDSPLESHFRWHRGLYGERE